MHDISPRMKKNKNLKLFFVAADKELQVLHPYVTTPFLLLHSSIHSSLPQG